MVAGAERLGEENDTHSANFVTVGSISKGGQQPSPPGLLR